MYRTVDSTGQTIDFLSAAVPRVINVDQDRSYPAAVERLKAEVSFRGGRIYRAVYIFEQHG